MITIETLVVTVAGLQRDDIELLIEQDCVRPAGQRGAWLFREIDVARLRLIQELRRDFDLQDEAIPVVLDLLDQLYATRRRLARLCTAIERTAPPEVRRTLADALMRPQH